MSLSRNSKIFFLFFLAFPLGIAVSLWSLPPLLFLPLFLILILFSLALFRFQNPLTILLTLLLGFSLGFFRSSLALTPLPSNHICHHHSSSPTLWQGYLTAFPAKESSHTELLLSAHQIIHSPEPLPVTGIVHVTTSKYFTGRVGEWFEVSCTLTPPENFEDFDYIGYLSVSNIHTLCPYATLHPITPPSPHPPLQNYYLSFLSSLQTLKSSFSSQVYSLFPSPSSSLVQALLLGDRDALTSTSTTSLRRSGLSHLVAVSGLHLTILITLLTFLLSFLPRRTRYLFTVFFVICFVLLVGATASVLRAALMGFIGGFATLQGRSSPPLRSLLLALFLLLFFNPRLLRWDISFQLSFLATLGIILIVPRLESSLEKKYPSYHHSLPSKLIFESIFITLSAQLFVIPLLAYHFQSLSLVSPLANILVTPIVPFIMLSSLIITSLSFLVFPLAKILGLFPHLLSSYLFGVSSLLGSLPLAFFEISRPSPLLILLYYLLLTLLLSFFHFRFPPPLEKSCRPS